jgi:hypothetical protein
VLCDPVYRHWYVLGDWRAFVPWIAIQIPCNVRRVDWLRQKTNWPRGHELVAECEGATDIADPILLECEHVHMAERMEFISLCERVAEESLGVVARPKAKVLHQPPPVGVRKAILEETTKQVIEQKSIEQKKNGS